MYISPDPVGRDRGVQTVPVSLGFTSVRAKTSQEPRTS